MCKRAEPRASEYQRGSWPCVSDVADGYELLVVYIAPFDGPGLCLKDGVPGPERCAESRWLKLEKQCRGSPKPCAMDGELSY